MNSDSAYAPDDYLKTDQRKRVFCILSDDRVYRTKSPAMFNAAIKQSGINGTYIPLKVEPDFLGNAIQSLKILNFAGANVTVPYKERVVGCMDKLSREARLIGAVNTVTLERDVIMGHNTNAIGFEKSVEEVEYLVDLNYGRQNYIFRDLAQKIGTRFMDGIPMLAHQASKSFALWTSIDIAPAIFLSGL